MSGPWGHWDEPLTEYPICIDAEQFPTEQEAAAEAWSWFAEVGEPSYLGNAPVTLTGERLTLDLCDEHDEYECPREDEAGAPAPCIRPYDVWELRFREVQP